MQNPESHTGSCFRDAQCSQHEKIETDDEESQDNHERQLLRLEKKE
jgi:hypothetical protein